MNEKMLKVIEKFRLVDDTFALVALNKDAIQFILQILLNNNFIQLDDLKTEFSIKSLQGRNIVTDFLATQDDNIYFNLELQFYKDGAAEQRAQYHANAISTYFSKHGDKWLELPHVIVVFIVNFDVFKMKQPIYTFDQYARECITIDENGQLSAPVKLKGRTIIYINTNAYYDENTSIGQLMHDLLCSDPEEMYFDVLKECVCKYKCTEKGMRHMCELMDNLIRESNEKVRIEALSIGRAEGKIEGKEEGSYETSLSIARNMLENGASLDFVTKCCHLTIDIVSKLQNELA